MRLGGVIHFGAPVPMFGQGERGRRGRAREYGHGCRGWQKQKGLFCSPSAAVAALRPGWLDRPTDRGTNERTNERTNSNGNFQTRKKATRNRTMSMPSQPRPPLESRLVICMRRLPHAPAAATTSATTGGRSYKNVLLCSTTFSHTV